MKIFPAIDLYGGKAVRLFKGDYNQMTVYSDNPIEILRDFEKAGAKNVHLVDLEGAKSGETPNLETVKYLAQNSPLFKEVGGGIRSFSVIEKYLSVGIDRVILGTIAVKDEEFLKTAVKNYGAHIAVGVDILDGKVAIKGWTEKSKIDAMDFLKKIEDIGVKTVICTDISKDGAMKGTNHDLYSMIKKERSLSIIASGGVSSMDDVIRLKNSGIYGAIIGKAYYTKAIDLTKAIEVADDN
jgi:phosphoribosylformimino-5-aminoimidazole carboxamide ribotide isomerase